MVISCRMQRGVAIHTLGPLMPYHLSYFMFRAFWACSTSFPSRHWVESLLLVAHNTGAGVIGRFVGRGKSMVWPLFVCLCSRVSWSIALARCMRCYHHRYLNFYPGAGLAMHSACKNTLDGASFLAPQMMIL